MVAGSPDPGDEVQPQPEGTVEMILKGMEKKPDDFQMNRSTKLADIGFVKEDFDNFVTYVYLRVVAPFSKVVQLLSQRLQRQATFRQQHTRATGAERNCEGS